MKICSFLPAATEIVFALGLGDDLYGVTHECDYPPEARQKAVVIEPTLDASHLSQDEIDRQIQHSVAHGHQLYRIENHLLQKIRPDVIITQELCDVCSVSLRDVLKATSELSGDCQVISLAPRGLHGVLDDILTIGKACDAEGEAARLVGQLEERIRRIEERSRGLKKQTVFCLEWYDPIFASGHWVPEMVEICGGVDELGVPGKDSRRILWEQVVSYDPDTIILMPCGFDVERALSDLPLLTRRAGWNGLGAVKNGRVYATNSSWYYSRPGPRLIDGLESMARIIHPETFGGIIQNVATRVDSRKLGITLA